MADTKTFKDIDKKLQKLVDETKENFKITKRWQAKLDDHALDLIDNLETNQKPRAKIQKEMLRVLETTESQSKVRARDKIAADFKTGKATIEQLKAAKLTKDDFVKSGFGKIGSNIEMMRQSWQETVGKFGAAVKNWWKWTKENSIVLQSAKKFWNSEAIKKLRGMVSQVAGIIKGHMSDILGEFQQVFDFVKQGISLVYKSITGAFTGLFDIVKQRRKEKREQKMVDHLQKIKDGIGFLVKGEKLDKISDVKKGAGSFIDKLLGFLGLKGLLAGGLLAGAGGLLAGAAMMALKTSLLALIGKFLFDAVNGAIKGWKADGLTGASEGLLAGITSLPRKIIGWIGEKVLDYYGFDGSKFKESLSDENTRDFIKEMNDTIQLFMSDMEEFLTEMFNMIRVKVINGVNAMIPDFLGLDIATGTAGSSSKAMKEANAALKLANENPDVKGWQLSARDKLMKARTESQKAYDRHDPGTSLKEIKRLAQAIEKIGTRIEQSNNIQINSTSNTVHGDKTGAGGDVPDPDGNSALPMVMF
jgi:hypothetical protein